MRTLILSCNTGQGHNSCAAAIREAFLRHGEECRIEDSLAFLSSGTSSVFSRGHAFVYRHLPKLFGKGYQFVADHDAMFEKGRIGERYFRRGAEALAAHLAEKKPDVVICTHALAALMLTQAREQANCPFLVTALAATDYECSPSVKESRLDWYFIPDERLREEFRCEAIPDDKIVASGIPVRRFFFSGISKKEAKARLGLPPEKKHVLLVCGSMGCGPIEKLTSEISMEKKQVELTVLCGNNRSLRKRMERRFRGEESIHIRGYEKDIPLLLDSADLYLTKPGGISVTEGAVKGVPMLLVPTVAGCEESNRRFFIAEGLAEETDPAQIRERLREKADPEKEKKRADALRIFRSRDGAEIMYQTLTAKESQCEIQNCQG